MLSFCRCSEQVALQDMPLQPDVSSLLKKFSIETRVTSVVLLMSMAFAEPGEHYMLSSLEFS